MQITHLFHRRPSTVGVVKRLPECGNPACSYPARYFFVTRHGFWMYGCWYHWQMFRASPLLGKEGGMELVTLEEVREVSEVGT